MRRPEELVDRENTLQPVPGVGQDAGVACEGCGIAGNVDHGGGAAGGYAGHLLARAGARRVEQDRIVPLQRSEEHTSELQSLMRISYAVFCLKKKNKQNHNSTYH